MVNASRRHLTERYAAGVDLLLWETEKRLIPDLDAIKSVTEAAASGRAEGLDVGAALVLVQAARLGLDRLEGELFEAAQGRGGAHHHSCVATVSYGRRAISDLLT